MTVAIAIDLMVHDGIDWVTKLRILGMMQMLRALEII